MITKEEFYNLYNKNSPENKNRHIGPIDARLFLRDLSLPIAFFLAKKNVSPSIITITFLIISIIANILFIIPSFWTIVSLVFLLELAQLLDCVDGQLARYYHSESELGENLDTLAHVLTSSLFMLSFGIRLYLVSSNILFLVLGVFGGIFKALDHYQIITKTTILDNPAIKSLYNKSVLNRYIFYFFQSLISEIRILAGFLAVLWIIDFYKSTNLFNLSFFVLLTISFFENFLYSVYELIKNLTVKKQIEI